MFLIPLRFVRRVGTGGVCEEVVGGFVNAFEYEVRGGITGAAVVVVLVLAVAVVAEWVVVVVVGLVVVV